MEPNWYEIINRAVEEGANYGVSRAYKHDDAPSQENIAMAVTDAVMNAICEVVNFSVEREPYG